MEKENPSLKVNRDALRMYMLSQDHDGELVEEMKKLEKRPDCILIKIGLPGKQLRVNLT